MHVDIHSVLIIKDGYIVAEQYYSDNYGIDSLHPIASCTKSITSALFGIAIEEHYLTGVQQQVIDFFPEYEIQNLTEQKESITENMVAVASKLMG